MTEQGTSHLGISNVALLDLRTTAEATLASIKSINHVAALLYSPETAPYMTHLARQNVALALELASDIQEFIRNEMPVWKRRYPGVETLSVAVMGCIVNGPGESKHADIGISLPGTGEAPAAPVFIDGKKAATLRGPGAAAEFKQMVLDYIERRYGQVGRSRTAAE